MVTAGAVGAMIIANIKFSPEIVCSASVVSSTTVARYYPDEDYQPSFVPVPQLANLTLKITNNVSQTLYNAVVEVKYKTSEGTWNTSREVIDVLGISQSRTVNITLANPAITIENTRQLNMYDPNHRFVNTVLYVLSIRDYEIVACGFAKK
jgi:hypothetical protein